MFFNESADTNRGFDDTKLFYREYALAYPQPQFQTCGDCEALASTIIFKKCGVKICSRGLEHYIFKIHLQLNNNLIWKDTIFNQLAKKKLLATDSINPKFSVDVLG